MSYLHIKKRKRPDNKKEIFAVGNMPADMSAIVFGRPISARYISK